MSVGHNAESVAPTYLVQHAPWAVEDDPEVWCVYEETGDGDDEYLSVACFRTEAEAEAHRATLIDGGGSDG